MRVAPLVACLALGGCAGGGQTMRQVAEDDASRSSARIVVTRDDLEVPRGCRPGPVARRIDAFLTAFNRGDGSAARFAAPELAPHGGWYSVTEGDPRGAGRHFVAGTQSELVGYFAGRHRHRERLRLLEVRVGFSGGLGHIEFRIDRRADDLRRLGVTTTIAYGKGALRCGDGRIVVWSMGMHAGRVDPHAGFEICPPPPTPVRAIVACASRWR